MVSSLLWPGLHNLNKSGDSYIVLNLTDSINYDRLFIVCKFCFFFCNVTGNKLLSFRLVKYEEVGWGVIVGSI
jgi:hypothetical protein